MLMKTKENVSFNVNEKTLKKIGMILLSLVVAQSSVFSGWRGSSTFELGLLKFLDFVSLCS